MLAVAKPQTNYSMYCKICFGIPQIKFHLFRLYPQFRGNAENIFCIFSSCTQRRHNFWKIYDAFLRQLFRLPANTIRAFLKCPFTRSFLCLNSNVSALPQLPNDTIDNLNQSIFQKPARQCHAIHVSMCIDKANTMVSKLLLYHFKHRSYH